MSTQPAVSAPEMPLIDDVPPAGTQCLVCKAMGHWCPAAKYIGDTDDGICKDCAAQTNCPVAARRQAKDYDVFDVPPEPAPVKHVPVPSKHEQHVAARAESVRAALAGAVGRDAVKLPVATQPGRAKKTPGPVVPVPSYMHKGDRPGNQLDVAAARKMRANGVGLKQIAGKLSVGVARLRRELDAKEKSTVLTTGIPKAILEKRANAAPSEANPAILPEESRVPVFERRKPLLEAIDDVIAHLEAEMVSIRLMVEMLKARKGAR